MAELKIRRIDFSPDEWLAGTFELSDQDRGIYITICSLIWSRGSRITEELLRRHSGSHGNAISASLSRLEKAGKIVRNGPEIGQKRAENELETAQKRLRNASENGAKGNKIRWDKDRKPTQEKIANHQPSTINHQLSEKDSEANASDGTSPSADPIKALWDRGLAILTATGLDEKKARSLVGRWRKEFGDALLTTAIAAAESERATEPVSFIAACLARRRTNGGARSPPERQIQAQIERAKRLRDSGDAAWLYSTDSMIEAAIRDTALHHREGHQ